MRAAPLATAALLVAAPDALAQQALRWPEPAAPVPRAVEERGESPMYYRLPADTVLVTARVGLGANARLATGGEEGDWAFALDVLLGTAVRFGRGSRLGLWAEGGYHFVGFSEHFASLGLGPILHRIGPADEYDPYERGRITLALVPRGLIGSVEGDFGAGVRTGLLFNYWFYGLEAAHQYVVVGERRVHEIHLVFTAPAFFGEEDP